MAKPRNRPKHAPSTRFGNITPTWSSPENPPIDGRFDAPCQSLADWIGPKWIDERASGFLNIRYALITACERWHAYDWQSDLEAFKSRKSDEKNREDIRISAIAFRRAIGRSSYRLAERDLGIAIVKGICPEAQPTVTHKEGCDAVVEALRKLEAKSSRKDTARTTFGPLSYGSLPRRLPKPEVAVALVLADIVTRERRDEHQRRERVYPRPPHLSKNLPWKAIAEFAGALSEDLEASLHPDNVATLVRNQTKSVLQIQTRPRLLE